MPSRPQRACCGAELPVWFPYAAESDIASAQGSDCLVSVRESYIASVAIPGTASRYVYLPRRWARRIIAGAGFVVTGAVPVFHPLRDVAMDIVQAPRVRLLLADGMGRSPALEQIFTAYTVPGHRRQRRSGIEPVGPGSRGVFPFGFSRQAVAVTIAARTEAA
jgi:hypothetical protein